MAKIQEKERVQRLRKSGRSIRDISKELEVSKSTVSYWCRDIVLSPEQKQKLVARQKHASAKSIFRLAEQKRTKRITDTKKTMSAGREDVGNVTKRDLFIAGIALYWGEGYKKGNEEFGFSNSDPAMIRFIIRWLKDAYDIPLGKLTLRVSINEAHQSRESAVLQYWEKITRIPRSQFTKTSFIKTKSKKEYANKNNHFGTLRVKVRNGTQLRRRVLGSIEAIGSL